MVYFDLPPEPAASQPVAVREGQYSSGISPGHSSGALQPLQPIFKPQHLEVADLYETLDTALVSPAAPTFTATFTAQLPTLEPLPSTEAPTNSDPISPSPSESTDPELAEPSSTDPAQSVPAPEPDGPTPDGPTLDEPTPSAPTDRLEIQIETDDDLTPEEFASRLKLSADYQEYNPETQVITARGNVLLELNDAIIEADEIWVNLINRYTLAEGNVLLTRGSQLIRGSSAEYNFIQRSGVIGNAIGTLYFPEIQNDLSSLRTARQGSLRRVYDPINRSSDPEVESASSVQLTSNPSAATIGGDNGQIRQLRFETNKLAFDAEGYVAEDVRITNDPFSPPELELRTDRLTLQNYSATQDELLLKRPRLVFDQGLSLPLFRSRILIDRGSGSVDPEDLNPVPVEIGIDGRDRGGLYIGRTVPIIDSDNLELTVTPQYSIAEAFNRESSSPFDVDNFGGTAELNTRLSPRTTLRGTADLTSLNFSKITENLRTSLRAEQLIGDHRLALQYSYRERLFNGSLGFQDVQSSFGAVLLSPDIALNNSGLRLTYQASAQLINAETDREDLLLASGSDTGRINLGRYQGSAALQQNFNLWRGEPKPPTQDEGLRFTPEPLVPYLDLTTGIRGTATYYSSGDSQENLIADIGIEGQVGHLSRNFGDYTRYRLSYSQSFIGGAGSPFLFDREVDRNVVTLGVEQQLYGPFIIGFQTAFSLSGGRTIDTIYSLEYSRRTYGILLRYDDAQSSGSIGFRLSNFSWVGDSNPFNTPRTRRVEGGVIEQR